MKTTAFFTRILGWLTGSRLTVDNSVVSGLDPARLSGNVGDPARFLGSWYEVARFDHFFERGMTHTKANYVIRDDGKIDVINTGIKNGKPKTAKGIAKLTDTPALLRVSFFGPFYSDYRIMLLDADYQYMLIGSGSDGYLWILSRTPRLSEEAKTELLSEARRRGYDTDRLIWVKQE